MAENHDTQLRVSPGSEKGPNVPKEKAGGFSFKRLKASRRPCISPLGNVDSDRFESNDLGFEPKFQTRILLNSLCHRLCLMRFRTKVSLKTCARGLNWKCYFKGRVKGTLQSEDLTLPIARARDARKPGAEGGVEAGGGGSRGLRWESRWMECGGRSSCT